MLFVEQPIVLYELEDAGYDFGSLFGASGTRDLERLYREAPAYKAIVDTIGADLGQLREEIKAGGRTLHEFTGAETGRVMDMRWLRSPGARLRLVGVVNRLDRRDFHDLRGEAGCGEMRLIFRLAYSFQQGRQGQGRCRRKCRSISTRSTTCCRSRTARCRDVALRWTPAGWPDRRRQMAGRRPLDRQHLRFRQLELNAQVVRFPSGQEPQFGGQAVYLMRIFGIDGDRVSELPLENTPDVARISADAALKAELAAYVRDNAQAIDQGVYMIPDRLLARKAISYSTFGNARQVNHPFAPLLSPQDFAGLDFSQDRLVHSPEALLERLDNGTCQGCHQSGATAGFHFIGLDDKFTSPLNRIEVGISPHFHAELPRRDAYVAAVAAGREPNRFRPLSFAPPANWKDDGGIAYEDAGLVAALPDAGGCGAVRRQLAMRRRHGLHAARHHRQDADRAGAMPAAAGCRDVFGPALPAGPGRRRARRNRSRTSIR